MQQEFPTANMVIIEKLAGIQCSYEIKSGILSSNYYI